MTDTILISIHPKHVQKILDLEKRYEYRKRVPAGITKMIIYSTRPVCRVVAVVGIQQIITASPRKVWNKTKHASGISRKFFSEYFREVPIANAIEISTVTLLKEPRELITVSGSQYPPQSFCYVDERVLRELL